MEFKVLTEAETKELSWRGRALLADGTRCRMLSIGSVIISQWSPNTEGTYMGIYLTRGGSLSDCHVEDHNGRLIEEGEEFAAHRALRVLRAHMVLDDLARI